MKLSILSGILLLQSFCLNAQIYTGSGGTITDDGIENLYAVNVSGLSANTLDSSFGLITVCLNLDHTYDSDLDVQLLCPDGTAITLFSGIGGGDDNFTGTCLNDNAPASITTGAAPFTDTYSPMDILGNANNGQNGNGTWILCILDTYPYADTGILYEWSLEFGNGATVPLKVDSTNLPLVLINTGGQIIVDEPKINVSMKIIYNGIGQMNHPDDLPNIYDGIAGIEIRGSYSASLPQKPYGFETRDVNGDNLNVSLLGMPSENDWILQATYNDKNFMRNSLACKLFSECGHYASRTRFCEVMIDNSYKGIYVLMEKIKRDNKRVDIAKLDMDDNAGDSLTGGYIIKVDYPDASNSWLSSFSPINYLGMEVYYVYEEPDESAITVQQKNYIQGFMYSLEDALYAADYTDIQTGYRAYLDVPSFIDYLLVNELARNNDGFKKSYFFYKDKDSNGGLLNSGPVWDFDWAWKNINECSIFAATDGSGWAYDVNDCSPDVNSPGWIKRLMQDSTFVNELKCRYLYLRSTIMDTVYLFHYIDSVHVLLNDAQDRHYRKWPILGINVGAPEIGPQPTTYDGEIEKFKEWIRLRIAWLDANMPGNCSTTNAESASSELLLRMFPNPVIDDIYIESTALLKDVCVYEMSGKLILSVQSNSNVEKLDFSSLSTGVYILKCGFQDGSVVYKKACKSE
jgi:subtilisin-like proprotein convertase family protein